MIPVTCVPWPFSSVGSRSPDPTSMPGMRRPFRSGWPRSTPLSTTATTISARPRVSAQAPRAPIASGPHCAYQNSSLGAPTGDGGVGAGVGVGVGSGDGSGGGSAGGSSSSASSTGTAAASTPGRRRSSAPRRARRARSRPSTRPAARIAAAGVSSAAWRGRVRGPGVLRHGAVRRGANLRGAVAGRDGDVLGRPGVRVPGDAGQAQRRGGRIDRAGFGARTQRDEEAGREVAERRRRHRGPGAGPGGVRGRCCGGFGRRGQRRWRGEGRGRCHEGRGRRDGDRERPDEHDATAAPEMAPDPGRAKSAQMPLHAGSIARNRAGGHGTIGAAVRRVSPGPAADPGRRGPRTPAPRRRPPAPRRRRGGPGPAADPGGPAGPPAAPGGRVAWHAIIPAWRGPEGARGGRNRGDRRVPRAVPAGRGRRHAAEQE